MEKTFLNHNMPNRNERLMTTLTSDRKRSSRPGLTPAAVMPSPQTSDEKLARALIKGAIPPEMAFASLAYSTGFPIWTASKTVIFLHWSLESHIHWNVIGDFNHWEKLPMKRARNHHLWYVEVELPQRLGKNIGYKFVTDEGRVVADPWALCFNYDENGELSYLKAPKRKQYLMRFNAFESPQGLRTRPLNILVPPNDGPYDVLYAHDGQNLFSPDSICGGWKLCEKMRNINGDFLIVGIFNTEDRLREYTHQGDVYFDCFQDTLGAKYADFVEHSVRPFIESRFSTTGRAGLMGSSLGGLISLYISNQFPGRYSDVFALSPTTAWGRFSDDHGKTIRDCYENSGHQNTFIYIDHGGEFPPEGVPDVLDKKIAQRDESDWSNPYDNCCYTFDFVNALVEIGYRQNIDLMYQHVPGAQHSESDWAARVERPLSLFMQKRAHH